MRIIAGTHRGRPLLGPQDAATTRPITDRVKETLFNRLHSLGVLGYGQTVDLFCGTGSMGLEALSRGAEHCTFVDMDRDAIDRLYKNLDAFNENDRALVLQASAMPPLWAARLADASITLAFLDPPYAMARATETENPEEDKDTQDTQDTQDIETPNARPPLPEPCEGIPANLLALFVALLHKLEPGGVLVYRTDADTTATEVPGYDGPARKTYGNMALHFFQRPMEEE